jgi:hypothetical protein
VSVLIYLQSRPFETDPTILGILNPGDDRNKTVKAKAKAKAIAKPTIAYNHLILLTLDRHPPQIDPSPDTPTIHPSGHDYSHLCTKSDANRAQTIENYKLNTFKERELLLNALPEALRKIDQGIYHLATSHSL